MRVLATLLAFAVLSNMAHAFGVADVGAGDSGAICCLGWSDEGSTGDGDDQSEFGFGGDHGGDAGGSEGLGCCESSKRYFDGLTQVEKDAANSLAERLNKIGRAELTQLLNLEHICIEFDCGPLSNQQAENLLRSAIVDQIEHEKSLETREASKRVSAIQALNIVQFVLNVLLATGAVWLALKSNHLTRENNELTRAALSQVAAERKQAK